MWSEHLIDVDLRPGWVTPRYLTTRDQLWIEAALDELTALVGQPRREVLERLARPPGLGESAIAWRAMVKLLLGLHGFGVRSHRPPQLLREVLFERAAARPTGWGRLEVLTAAARELDISPAELERDLYADLPGEQLLRPPVEPLSAAELVFRYNLMLAQALLQRSEALEVKVSGSVRAAVRFARLQRLLCLARRDPLDGGALLYLSGPLSLFHHTTKYGRSMAAWLPVVVRCPRWKLEATCQLRGERRVFRASYRDPLGSTHAPLRRFDSAVEERLFRDLRRQAPGWQVLREADPAQVGGHILCPDFTLVDERRGLRVPVEIVGFWTPGYLATKMVALRQLPPGSPWLVCIDERLSVARQGPRPELPVFWFKRRVDVRAFLDHLEQWIARAGPRVQVHVPDRAQPPPTMDGHAVRGAPPPPPIDARAVRGSPSPRRCVIRASRQPDVPVNADTTLSLQPAGRETLALGPGGT